MLSSGSKMEKRKSKIKCVWFPLTLSAGNSSHEFSHQHAIIGQFLLCCSRLSLPGKGSLPSTLCPAPLQKELLRPQIVRAKWPEWVRAMGGRAWVGQDRSWREVLTSTHHVLPSRTRLVGSWCISRLTFERVACTAWGKNTWCRK